MQTPIRVILIGTMLFAALVPAAYARNTTEYLPIKDALADPRAPGILGTDIRFYFGQQAVPGSRQDLGEFVTNRKTNAFGKSDAKACRWAMISALKQLAERARNLGGNAVINIVSFYKKNEHSSETDYECHAGGLMAGVALKGRVVKLSP